MRTCATPDMGQKSGRRPDLYSGLRFGCLALVGTLLLLRHHWAPSALDRFGALSAAERQDRDDAPVDEPDGAPSIWTEEALDEEPVVNSADVQPHTPLEAGGAAQVPLEKSAGAEAVRAAPPAPPPPPRELARSSGVRSVAVWEPRQRGETALLGMDAPCGDSGAVRARAVSNEDKRCVVACEDVLCSAARSACLARPKCVGYALNTYGPARGTTQ